MAQNTLVENKQPLWLFSAEEIASIPPYEKQFVRKLAAYIIVCSEWLSLPLPVAHYAVVLLTRYDMLYDLEPRTEAPYIAAACLFLACKVQETHKRLRDVVFWTVKVRTRKSRDYPGGEEVLEGSVRYVEEKENLLSAERDVLRCLHFDIFLETPHSSIVQLAKIYGNTRENQRMLAQFALNVLHDTYVSIPFLHIRYRAKEIATALVAFAAAMYDYALPDKTIENGQSGQNESRLVAFHEYFQVNRIVLNEIWKRVLDCYEPEYSSEDKTNSLSKEENRHR
ncbi:hypothetical protein Gasu2_37230 [Galdieria sulphuraria]|uniref:Cyclin family protein n=1 Tax=Galdieria sulphuraria TaxID=130081 RepID=M2VVR8_GALSU|nr:cyclin family protein [Galdieria sulphuraria]EME27321.1 cyclin family protein [Galdieria sulphuraria]GJD09473.1 hypothetical protein Gasu2_37230 [Galdieria sulphuraria]|eukprot:XP_005703841.1 cyclin family protein [Galdieria sulphuraria]